MATVIPESEITTNRRRSIDPQSGRALEILGHAIEYLTDELLHEEESSSTLDPRIKAIQMLMASNREIYFACPVVPTFLEKCRALLRAVLLRTHLHREPAMARSGRDVRLTKR